jgi:hypothetical protein
VIRKACFVALFCCAVAICFAAQKHPPSEEVKTFELYSWQDAKGGWTFSLWPAISSAGLHPDVILRQSSALAGQEKLQRAIAALPAGSEIVWLDHAVGMWKDAKGWKRIKYPPGQVITELRKYCKTKGYNLSVEQAKELKD